MDKHQGHGGTYEVDKASGERRLKEKPTQPHATGGARDKDGELLEQLAKDAKPEPALPEPAPAPWAAPAPQPAADAKKKGA